MKLEPLIFLLMALLFIHSSILSSRIDDLEEKIVRECK